MWEFTEPWWAIIVRVSLVYAFVLALLRLSGKRQLGQLTPMDLLTMLLLSETVSPALTADDSSISAGFVASATLVGLAIVVSVVTYRSRMFERAVEGTPSILIINGEVRKEVMAAERITRQQLEIARREHGLESVHDVRMAVVEPSGAITCVPRSHPS